jgi:hypothetical protein
MLKHEIKLIDPDAEQIVAALTETTAAANKRCRARLLDDNPTKWQKFARDAAAKPEGYAMFRGGRGGVPATQVLAAWWTDTAGRKHVVLRGRRIEHQEAKRLLHKEELDTRPPLWHAYPEYVCRRTVGSESQIVCACGCGAVGTPESLGWMGETCGPCFDRKEEVGTGALSANLPGVLYGDRAPLRGIACSPDGTRVAAVEGENCVTYWDIPNRTRTVMKFSGTRVMDVAITSDGQRLVAVGANPLSPSYGLFAVFDLTTDPLTRLDANKPDEAPSWYVTALPDPGLVLTHRVHPPGFYNRAQFVRVGTGQPAGHVPLPSWAVGPFSRSPDGKRFAASGSGVLVFDSDGRTLWEGAGATRATAFSHDGLRLFAQHSDGLGARDAETGCHLFTSLRGRSAPLCMALAVDPAGEWVYGADYQGAVTAFVAGTLEPRACLEWHLGAITGLAISADGSRLFSSGADGCVKVWPIRDLMK